MTPRSVAVVGGGITGLTAALLLVEEADVTLFEAEAHAGGKVRTMEFAGGHVEAGPDSFLAREDWVEDLCRRVGLADDLIRPAVFGGAVWIDGRLRRFPARAMWGLPASPGAALRADALAWPQRLRALGDLVASGPLAGGDVSVAEFVRHRFGRGVLDNLVDPLLAGTRAGSTRDMSLAAALPQINAMARKDRSIMRAARAQRAAGAAPAFLSLRGGMQRLTDALDEALATRVALRKNTMVASIDAADDGIEVTTAEGTSAFDAVVVCVPAPAAADLLRKTAPGAARELDEIVYAPSVSVALRYPSGGVDPPPDTSGVLVPSNQGLTISGCTWWSTKWPGAVTGDGEVVRCFVGRGEAAPADDAELAVACARDVATIAGTKARPLEHSVVRWERGLPQYRLGHLERLDKIEAALPRGLVLAGAGYRGSGLPDCVKQAHRAVRKVIEPDQPH